MAVTKDGLFAYVFDAKRGLHIVEIIPGNPIQAKQIYLDDYPATIQNLKLGTSENYLYVATNRVKNKQKVANFIIYDITDKRKLVKTSIP